MPELPEVETVRRGLMPAMQGQRLDAVIPRRPNLRFPLPDGLASGSRAA
ncbi:MAG TPA: DNA-formamidopyrimidine glycosylase, partial [Rhodospirillaceae bacterium]|nr:DNA-formamidopyrimidine glycosylase [Rhodospirillaceae bacterium]